MGTLNNTMVLTRSSSTASSAMSECSNVPGKKVSYSVLARKRGGRIKFSKFHRVIGSFYAWASGKPNHSEIYDEWDAYQTFKSRSGRYVWIRSTLAKSSLSFKSVRYYLQAAMRLCPTPADMDRKWPGTRWDLVHIANEAWGKNWTYKRPESVLIKKQWDAWLKKSGLTL